MATFMEYAGSPELVKFSKLLCLLVWGCLLLRWASLPRW